MTMIIRKISKTKFQLITFILLVLIIISISSKLDKTMTLKDSLSANQITSKGDLFFNDTESEKNRIIYVGNFSTEKKFINNNIEQPDKHQMLLTLIEIVATGSRHPSKSGNNFTFNIIREFLDYAKIEYIKLPAQYEYDNRNYTINNLVIPFIASNYSETTLFLAHIDTYSENYAGKPDIDDAPGADDDASGITALLFGLLNLKILDLKSNFVVAFCNGEIKNHIGAQIVLDYLQDDLELNITRVIYLDRLGNKDSPLMVFYNDQELREQVIDVASYLNLKVEDGAGVRSEGIFNEEEYYIERGLKIAIISEENYANPHIYSSYDTVDDISIDKVVNATILFQGLVIKFAFDIPENNSHEKQWLGYMQRNKIPIIDIDDTNLISQNDTIILSDQMTVSEIAEVLYKTEVKKVILLGLAAAQYIPSQVPATTSIYEKIFLNLTDPTLTYHPILNGIIFPIYIDRGLFLKTDLGLHLAEVSANESLITLFEIGDLFYLYIGVTTPFDELTNIFANFHTWRVLDTFVCIKDINRQFYIGDFINTTILFKNPLSWENIEGNATIRVADPENQIFIDKTIQISGETNLSFMLQIKGAYNITVDINGERFEFSISSDPPITNFVASASGSIYQGDILTINASFTYLKNEITTVNIVITNENTSEAQMTYKQIIPGNNSLSLTFEDTWLSGRNNLRMSIHINSLEIFSTNIEIIIRPIVVAQILNSSLEIQQQDSMTIALKIKRTIDRNITIRIIALESFSGEIYVSLNSSEWKLITLTIKHISYNPYDFGRKVLRLNLLLDKHIIGQLIQGIDVRLSLGNAIIGFIIPISLIGIATTAFLKHQFSNKVIPTENFGLENLRYMDSITFSNENFNQATLERYLQQQGFHRKEGLFFRTFYKEDIAILIASKNNSVRIQCHSKNPIFPFRYCEIIRKIVGKDT